MPIVASNKQVYGTTVSLSYEKEEDEEGIQRTTTMIMDDCRATQQLFQLSVVVDERNDRPSEALFLTQVFDFSSDRKRYY